MANRLSGFLVVGVSLGFAACGGDNLTLPSEGEPAAIAVDAGWNGITGRVGTELAPLNVTVTDTKNRPVAGATVEFEVTAGAGVIDPASAVTGNDGRATTHLTLGSQVGPVSGVARVPVPAGTVPVQTTFNATAVSADANGMALVSGDNQSGLVGTALALPLVVKVTDGFNNPIPGIPIQWAVGAGEGGSVSESSTNTDAQGLASVTRTLGSSAGNQTTIATGPLGLAGSPITFEHTASAGNAARVTIISGDGQTARAGSALPVPLTVQVFDADNNPIVNTAVQWVVATGGGSASPRNSRTDAEGKTQTTWSLGRTPGTNTLNAVVSEAGAGVVTFNAIGTKLPSTTAITSHTPERSTVGGAVRVVFTVTGSGSTPSGNVSVSATGGSETCTGTVADGFCNITLVVPGTRSLAATYAGDTQFEASTSASVDHIVDPAPPPNGAPTAGNDAYTTIEGAGNMHVPSAGRPILLNNDSDPEKQDLRAVLLSNPANGTLTNFTDLGGFDYSPNPDFFGDDTFTYRVVDESGAPSNPATVTITVQPVNDPPQFAKGADQTVPATSVGVPQVVSGWATNINAGAANESGQTLNFVVTSDNPGVFSDGPAISADGTLTYTPAGTGSATVTVQLHDDGGVANGGSDTSTPQTFSITVSP